MNWNLIAFTALMVFFILGALVMLYFQWLDGYVRKWRYEKEMNTTSTTDGQPTVTWVLEAKFKELTDEEIIKVYEDMLGVASARGSAIDFARAILLKAQEK